MSSIAARLHAAPVPPLTAGAFAQLQVELRRAVPALHGPLVQWLKSLAISEHPEKYFLRPLGFPLVYLPWWLESALQPAPDEALQADLIYSSLNGYCFIRLVDNLMDGHATNEAQLLPAAGFFHTQFQFAYQRHFDASHPFWEAFRALWFQSADAAARDAQLPEIDLPRFQAISGRKVCAAKIPLHAVAHRRGVLQALPAWEAFVDRYGEWHQLHNDVFDWNKDLKYQTRTYFLCEAGRRKRPGETVAAWVVREGFDWGMALLRTWLGELRAAAAPLGSPGLTAYLELRDEMLVEDEREVADGMRRLARLAAAWR